MSNIIYIDTRPGKGIFSAPKGEPDYSVWILNKYNHQQFVDGKYKCCFGIAQKLHKIFQEIEPQEIVVLGLHGAELEQFILFQAKKLGKNLSVEVFNGD